MWPGTPSAGWTNEHRTIELRADEHRPVSRGRAPGGAPAGADPPRPGPARWTEPGAHPVADGVHRIPLSLPLDGLRAVNVYVLQTDRGLVLIDGGWAIAVARRELESALHEIGYHPRDIEVFLVTHAHRDHYTQAAAIRTEFGRARVALGAGDRPSLRAARSGTEVFLDRLRSGGADALLPAWRKWGEDNRADPEDWRDPDVWLDGEHSFDLGSRRLAAVPTPGHTAGHFVFADLDAGLLFAGDHVLPTITPSVGFSPSAGEEPLRDYLESLRRILALPDLRVLPAHGPVTQSSHARAVQLLDHHEQRLAIMLAAVASGAHTPYQIAGAIPWTKHQQSFSQLDPIHAGMAVLETMTHLDLMVIRGQLVRERADGRHHYRPPPAETVTPQNRSGKSPRGLDGLGDRL